MSAGNSNSTSTTGNNRFNNGVAAAASATASATVTASKKIKSGVKSVARQANRALPGPLSFSNNNEEEPDYRWEELQSIEKRRRAILQRVEEPFWKLLFHWDGTVFRQIARDPLFWITIAIYVGIRIQVRLSNTLPSYVDELGNGQIALLGGFLTFFLVFWVNQNHKRYFMLYGNSMACKGRIFDVATIAKTILPKEVAYRLVRYMNAAHAAGYVGLSAVYPSHSYFRHVNDHCRLLTDGEMERMNEIDLDKGGACNRELIVWCISEINQAKIKYQLDNELVNLLHNQVLQLRAQIGQLYNAADLPVPFFYVHFISLLTVMYLPLFAISAAYKAGTGSDIHWTADVVAGLVVILQSIFVIGLRVLGQKMSDPYGDDLVDLSVIFYVNFTWQQSFRILASHFAPTQVSWEEESKLIGQRMFDIGSAWDMAQQQTYEGRAEFNGATGGAATSSKTYNSSPIDADDFV